MYTTHYIINSIIISQIFLNFIYKLKPYKLKTKFYLHKPILMALFIEKTTYFI